MATTSRDATDEPSAPPVGSVDKALVLLGQLAAVGPEGTSLGELSRRTGYTKASVHRLLQALSHRGYADQDTLNRAYRMGTAPGLLVDRFYGEENLPALLRPVLTAISQRTRELVHLGVLAGASVVYLEKVEPERTIRVWSRVGHRAPAARTALGRALLASGTTPGTALDAYLAAAREPLPVIGPEVDPVTGTPVPSGRPSGTAHANLSAQRLTEVLADARRRGWAEEVEENEEGVSCVAASLRDGRGRPLAVSVTGPAERMTTARRAEIGALLREELALRAPAGFTLTPAADPSASTAPPTAAADPPYDP